MSYVLQREFQAACAHEYGHTWLCENVEPQRLKTLSRDAQEGFCELIAYRFMESLHEETQLWRILHNPYTHEHIKLMIAAEKAYGFNDLLDWIRWGVNGRLRASEPAELHNVQLPRAKATAPAVAVSYPTTQAVVAPSQLKLKGIIGAKEHALALINDASLAMGETAKVRLGSTNLMVRCLAIGTHSVRIEVLGSGQQTELELSQSASH